MLLKMMINIQLTLINEIKQILTFFDTYQSTSLLLSQFHIHMAFLKFIARTLIITALVSSAYHHLNSPVQSIQEFNSNYKVLDHISNQYLSYDIPYDSADWKTTVRVFGLFQALVSCLIIFGDPMGAFLYVVSISLEIFFLIWPRFISKTLTSWSFSQMEEVSHFLSLLGIGLILTCRGHGHQTHKHQKNA